MGRKPFTEKDKEVSSQAAKASWRSGKRTGPTGYGVNRNRFITAEDIKYFEVELDKLLACV